MVGSLCRHYRIGIIGTMLSAAAFVVHFCAEKIA
jgi:hypothetical protein